MKKRIAAVFFDFGNVFTLPPDDRTVRTLAGMCGLDLREFLRRYRRARNDYDRGSVDPLSYWSSIADGGTPLSEEKLASIIECDNSAWGQINKKTYEWAKSLKNRGIVTGILSNMPFPYAEFTKKSFPWFSMFDSIIISCEIGIIKPEPGIYHYALSTVSVPPEEVLFIDDLEVNIKGALDAGMQGVQFLGMDELLDTINRDFIIRNEKDRS